MGKLEPDQHGCTCSHTNQLRGHIYPCFKSRLAMVETAIDDWWFDPDGVMESDWWTDEIATVSADAQKDAIRKLFK